MPHKEDCEWFHSHMDEYWIRLSGRSDLFEEKSQKLLEKMAEYKQQGWNPTPKQITWLKNLVDKYERQR